MMRITTRGKDNRQYWENRWADIPVDEPMTNETTYPLRHALMAVKARPEGRILEAGCGAGRLLRYFHERDYRIVGFDFIDAVVRKLKAADASLNVETGDICALDYPDESFQCVLAFGLFHNLPPNGCLDTAFQETWRVLTPGGLLCASFRADNPTTRITDWLRQRESKSREAPTQFHKLNLTETEFREVLTRNGFCVEAMHYVVNMPVLYKFRFFRQRQHKQFDEHRMRREGCRLNALGALLQRALMRYCPEQYCNIFVAMARKPAREELKSADAPRAEGYAAGRGA